MVGGSVIHQLELPFIGVGDPHTSPPGIVKVRFAAPSLLATRSSRRSSSFAFLSRISARRSSLDRSMAEVKVMNGRGNFDQGSTRVAEDGFNTCHSTMPHASSRMYPFILPPT